MSAANIKVMALSLPSTFSAAFSQERATRPPRKPRTPLLTHAGRAAARLTRHAERARTAALSLAGFGCLDYAAYQANPIAGWAAIGGSLLLVEWLTGGDQ